jgi:glycyl-tRNA synthetase
MSKDITSCHLIPYGFLFPNADIYGGLAKSWDLGPHGTELKRKLKDLWWKYFITTNPYNVGSDSLILTHPEVLKSSGHLKNFHDWLIECSSCKKRYRLDNLISAEQFTSFLVKEDKQGFATKNCPHCGRSKFTNPRQFNLLLSSDLQITDQGEENIVYLRPETCQGIFINFTAIQRSTRKKLPFGVGQIGKSFRNEITLHRGIFRTREFEQMELEFFILPGENEKWWEYWNQKAWIFLGRLINDKKKIKQVFLSRDELPHYAKKTTDLYFEYHFGWGELCSISDRGDYDLKSHNDSENSVKKLETEGIIPHVIEVSFGVERLMLALLENSYQKETLKVEKGKEVTREVLKLPPLLAPYFVAIIPQPIGKKDEEQEERRKRIQTRARELYLNLLNKVNFSVVYEEDSSIGKAYRRQDAIGTYYCLTVDVYTVDDTDSLYNTVTLRHRDTMEQDKERKPLDEIVQFLSLEYLKHYQELIKN